MKHSLKLIGALSIITAVIAVFILMGNDSTTAQAQSGPESPWQSRCTTLQQESGGQIEKCEVFQRLTMQETGQRLIEFAIGSSDQQAGLYRGVFLMPLGILIQPGVLMQIDENPPYKFDIHHCADTGCVAFVDLNAQIVDKLRKGEKAKVIMKAVDGKNIQITMSLSGFTKAFENVK